MWKIFIAGFCVAFALFVVVMVIAIKYHLKKLKTLRKEIEDRNEKLTSLVNKLQMQGVVNENLHTGNSDDDFINSLNMLQNSRKARGDNSNATTAKGGRHKR